MVKTYQNLSHHNYVSSNAPSYKISRNAGISKTKKNNGFSFTTSPMFNENRPKTKKSKMTHGKHVSTILYPLAEKTPATSKFLTNNLGTNLQHKQKIAGMPKTSILYTGLQKEGSFDKSLQKGSVQQSRNKDVKKSKSISEHDAISFHIMNKKPESFRLPNSGANSIEVSKLNLHALKEEKGENAEYFLTNNSKIKEKAVNSSEIYLPDSATATPRL